MTEKLAKTVKFLVVILMATLFLCLFCFVGCSKDEDTPPQSPPTENNSNNENNNFEENSGNSSNNEQNNNPSLPEDSENSENNTFQPAPPSENNPNNNESSNQNSPSEDDNNENSENNGENQENADITPPSDENADEDSSNNEDDGKGETNEEKDDESENLDPDTNPPTVPTNEYSLSLKTFESTYGYEFENKVFKIDFAASNILYFQFKLLKNQELIENVHFNVCLSDPSFGIFDSVNYNSVFIEIQKVGEFEITISSSEHNFSETFKVVVM